MLSVGVAFRQQFWRVHALCDLHCNVCEPAKSRVFAIVPPDIAAACESERPKARITPRGTTKKAAATGAAALQCNLPVTRSACHLHWRTAQNWSPQGLAWP